MKAFNTIRSIRAAALALSLAMIATTALAASSLASPTGTITRATATPDWTHGTIAGSVAWDECTTENHCSWLPEVVAEPALPEYHCASEDALSSDPNIRTVWTGASHTTNIAVNFEVSHTLILQGVFGQRACLMAIYNARHPDPVCVAQKKPLEELLGIEVVCPPENHTAFAPIASALFTVEQPPVVTPPVLTPPSGGSGGGSGGGETFSIGSAQIRTLVAGQLTPSGKAAKIATLLKSGAYTVVFKALEAGTAVIDWYEVPPGAKLAKKTKPKPVLVAAGQRTFSAAGTATLKIKLTAAGRSLLKHAKQVKLTAKGTFTPSGTTPVATTRTFVLKR